MHIAEEAQGPAPNRFIQAVQYYMDDIDPNSEVTLTIHLGMIILINKIN